jgi:hypothetical protein
MVEAQWRVIEMEQCEVEMVMKIRCAILDRTTFMEKGIKILNPKQLMWTQTKHNYDRHVERMEN